MRYGNEEEQSRKLFIGGISLNTSDEGMREYFSKYGNITDCVVIKEQGSNRSKGFGFVTFETEEEADKCMGERPHSIDGRTVDAKRAVSREESSKPGAHVQVKKVFVGGVKQGCDESMLREYFGKFGNIVSVEIPLDREKQTPKGFGFVTFDDYDVTDKLVAKRHHDVCGFRCEVKKALSREEMEKAKQQLDVKHHRSYSSGGGGGGGGGGGRGGRGSSGGRGGRGRRGGGGGGGGGDGYGGGYDDAYSNSGYGGGYGGGPMRGQYGQSQRSSGPYGGGYGSGSGGYGSAYGSSGNDYSGYGSGYGNYSGDYNKGYGSNNNNGYGSYGSQGNSYYGDTGSGKY